MVGVGPSELKRCGRRSKAFLNGVWSSPPAACVVAKSAAFRKFQSRGRRFRRPWKSTRVFSWPVQARGLALSRRYRSARKRLLNVLKHLLHCLLVRPFQHHRIDGLTDWPSCQAVLDIDVHLGLLTLRFEVPVESTRHPTFNAVFHAIGPLVCGHLELFVEGHTKHLINDPEGIAHPLLGPHNVRHSFDVGCVCRDSLRVVDQVKHLLDWSVDGRALLYVGHSQPSLSNPTRMRSTNLAPHATVV